MLYPASSDPELTVSDLIELLAEHDPDTPVRLAAQPAWAFTHALAALAVADTAGGVIYLAEGDQLSYLPDSARHALTEAGDSRWSKYT
jgi:hypothetical protein